MMLLGVRAIDLRPGRREEHAAVISMQLTEVRQDRLAGRVLERRRRIDQPSVEEDPSVQSTRSLAVGEGHRNGPASEGRSVNPRQSRTMTLELFPGMIPPPRFFDDRVTARPQLRQQR